MFYDPSRRLSGEKRQVSKSLSHDTHPHSHCHLWLANLSSGRDAMHGLSSLVKTPPVTNLLVTTTRTPAATCTPAAATTTSTTTTVTTPRVHWQIRFHGNGTRGKKMLRQRSEAVVSRVTCVSVCVWVCVCPVCGREACCYCACCQRVVTLPATDGCITQ